LQDYQEKHPILWKHCIISNNSTSELLMSRRNFNKLCHHPGFYPVTSECLKLKVLSDQKIPQL